MIKDSAFRQEDNEKAVVLMIPLSKTFLSLGLFFVLMWPPGILAQTSPKDSEQAAHLLATFLNAGRVVIEHNQLLINDPRKGDKGFTPEVF